MVLYHYCSPEGFLGIMQSKKLWLSGLHNMSDYLDGSWVAGIISDIFYELSSEYSQDAINKVATSYNHSKFSPYVCCFSEDGDLLSQWRGYASDGSGFSIGFNSDIFPCSHEMPRMANLGDGNKEKLSLSRIEYDADKQKSLVKHLVEFALRYEENGRQFDTNLMQVQSAYLDYISQEMGVQQPFPYFDASMDAVIRWLVGYAVIAKNPAFHEEKEHRLIHAPFIMANRITNKTTQSLFELSEPKYRISGNRICSYYEFDFSEYVKDGIVQEVILGPKNDTSGSDLRALLGRMDKPDIEIKKSRVSYR